MEEHPLTESEYMDTLAPRDGVPRETWRDAQGVTFERVEIVEGFPETAVDMPVCSECGNGPLDYGEKICEYCIDSQFGALGALPAVAAIYGVIGAVVGLAMWLL